MLFFPCYLALCCNLRKNRGKLDKKKLRVTEVSDNLIFCVFLENSSH